MFAFRDQESDQQMSLGLFGGLECNVQVVEEQLGKESGDEKKEWTCDPEDPHVSSTKLKVLFLLHRGITFALPTSAGSSQRGALFAFTSRDNETLGLNALHRFPRSNFRFIRL
jgi:hypothetical protein